MTQSPCYRTGMPVSNSAGRGTWPTGQQRGKPPKLLDQVRQRLRVRHYSLRTEKAYIHWIRQFIFFHNVRHPREMGKLEIEAFLTHMAIEKHVAASTQTQALCALLFLYNHVLDVKLPSLDAVRAKRPKRLPVVLSCKEVQDVLDQIEGAGGVYRLMAELMYGSGLRVIECCRLRVKDIDFARGQIIVREGKGDKDRAVPLPERTREPLSQQIERVRRRHESDVRRGFGSVQMPTALARKLPGADTRLEWQFVFPSERISRDPRGGIRRRHHLHENAIGRAVTAAGRRAGLRKRITCHTFRHSFATHLLETNNDIRTVQELLGHQDVRTTMIYTHVLKRGACGVRSPLDRLEAGGS